MSEDYLTGLITVPIMRSFSGRFFPQLCGGAGAAATMIPFINRFKIMPANPYGCFIPFGAASRLPAGYILLSFCRILWYDRRELKREDTDTDEKNHLSGGRVLLGLPEIF